MEGPITENSAGRARPQEQRKGGGSQSEARAEAQAITRDKVPKEGGKGKGRDAGKTDPQNTEDGKEGEKTETKERVGSPATKNTPTHTHVRERTQRKI